jgi:ubiquinone/menaquinone biosynthesis C-methylase UbiE
MTFAVAADAYDRFMGRYSTRLAAPFADFAGVGDGMRVVDVGCGPGALTRVLVERLGTDAVVAADPSEPFVAAMRERYPGLDVRQAAAEALPFPDDAFDAALAQLVVHFMVDPVRGIREMARVTRPGGVVAACTWDIANASPLTPFWRAVREVEPRAEGEEERPGTHAGDLEAIFAEAGLADVEERPITLTVTHQAFDEWWDPFALGVGPAGQYAASLDADRRVAVREQARAMLGDGPFDLTLRVWAARGRRA